MQKTRTLNLSIHEIQIIAAALHEAPYRIAAPVLSEIERQLQQDAKAESET